MQEIKSAQVWWCSGQINTQKLVYNKTICVFPQKISSLTEIVESTVASQTDSKNGDDKKKDWNRICIFVLSNFLHVVCKVFTLFFQTYNKNTFLNERNEPCIGQNIYKCIDILYYTL